MRIFNRSLSSRSLNLRSVLLAALVLCALSASPALARSGSLGGRVLRMGMKGADVGTLQADLSRLGFRTPADGVFGPATERNVVRFERRYRLSVNGLVDAAFKRRLTQLLTQRHDRSKTPVTSGAVPLAPPTTSPVGSPSGSPAGPGSGSVQLGQRVLQSGMTGADVRELQTDLTIAGFPTGVDGGFGPQTQSSVIAFEQAHGFTPDGIVTAAVAKLLLRTVASLEAGGSVAKATINSDGTAAAPAGAPATVRAVIAAANQISSKPYRFAGGHQRWNDRGYDCSGAVSHALHGAGLLSSSKDSTELESYGSAGPGRWITIYADRGHTWIVVAGLAFNTAHYAAATPKGSGPRWFTDPTANLADGGRYFVRHPAGL